MRTVIVLCTLLLYRAICLGYVNQYGGDINHYLQVVEDRMAVTIASAIAVFLDGMDLIARVRSLGKDK